MRQISLDTETTGLDPKQGHRVIEIGCVEIINRRITDNHFHCYINPQRDIDQGAQAVHGIKNDFLADKPVFNDIVNQLIDYLQGADEIIIHNAPFDVSFLNHEFTLSPHQLPTLATYADIVDTLKMARHLHPGQKNNLDALCKRYAIDNSHRELHGALVDADLLARVYLLMTGGQDSLFAEKTHITSAQVTTTLAKKQHSKLTKSFIPNGKLSVVYANKDELAQHAAYLKTIRSDS